MRRDEADRELRLAPEPSAVADRSPPCLTLLNLAGRQDFPARISLAFSFRRRNPLSQAARRVIPSGRSHAARWTSSLPGCGQRQRRRRNSDQGNGPMSIAPTVKQKLIGGLPAMGRRCRFARSAGYASPGQPDPRTPSETLRDHAGTIMFAPAACAKMVARRRRLLDYDRKRGSERCHGADRPPRHPRLGPCPGRAHLARPRLVDARAVCQRTGRLHPP